MNKQVSIGQVKQSDLFLVSRVNLKLNDPKFQNADATQILTNEDFKRLIQGGARFAVVSRNCDQTSKVLSLNKKDKRTFAIHFEDSRIPAIGQFERVYMYPLICLKEEFKEYSVISRITSSPYADLVLGEFEAEERKEENKSSLDFVDTDMQYVMNNKKAFNTSQWRILSDVSIAYKKKHEILLVQGPPGTGKSTTICGMLGMILQRENTQKKIHLCAPSNSAVDEILLRIARKGVPGFSAEQMKNMIIRVGAQGYRGPEELNCMNIKVKIQEDARRMEI